MARVLQPFCWSVAGLFMGLHVTPLLRADDAPAVKAPSPAPPATTEQIQQTIDRGIGYVQAESKSWMSTRKCASCHHASLAFWALNHIEREGYTIDRKFVSEQMESIIGSHENMISSKLIPGPKDPPDTRPLAKGVRTATVFMAFAAHSMPSLTEGQKQSLREITDDVVQKQRADGGWDFFLSRPPINDCEASDAAWIVLALQGESARGETSRKAALEKATAWLNGTKFLGNPQDKALTLLVALNAGEPREKLQSTIQELRAQQRPDGGWGQLPELPSDAYATGQALYVLALAGESADRPEIRRAIDFLVATQKPDGSWPMESRASNDGKPGGKSKLLTPINTAAGGWATLALAKLSPKHP